MSQSHFTSSFPLKPSAGAIAIAEQFLPLMPPLFRVQDGIGTIHYSRSLQVAIRTAKRPVTKIEKRARRR